MRNPLALGVLILSISLSSGQSIRDLYNEQCEPSIGFVVNKGQLLDAQGNPCPQVPYYSEGMPLTIFCEDSSRVTFAAALRDTSTSLPDTILNVRMTPTGGGSLFANPSPFAQKTHVKHFYLPHTQGVDASNVAVYDGMWYKDLAKDVDLYFHSGSGGMKISFVCKPGFNPGNLKLEFEGQDSLGLDIEGALKLWRDGKWLKLEQAVAFQVDGNNDVVPLNWNAEYQPNNSTGIVSFQFDDYDPDRALILQAGPGPYAGDETDGLCWSTYLGGSNEDYIYTSGADAGGNYFVAGNTLSTYTTFPNFVGISLNFSIQTFPIFLTRFNALHELRWTAFYGGETYDQYPYAMAVQNGDHPDSTRIYIGGSISGDGLYLRPNANAYYDDTGVGAGNNGFLARFRLDGRIEWSTYFGNANTKVLGLDLDSLRQLVVVGSSIGSVPLPEAQPSGSFVRAYTASSDGFVVALDQADKLRWGTFVGDSLIDDVRAVRCHGNRIIAVGSSSSPDYQPIDDGGTNAYDQPAHGGGYDITVTEFDLNGAIQWGTFLGTPDQEYVEGWNALAIGPAGSILLLAKAGPNMPVVPGVGWHQTDPTDRVLVEFGADRSRIWTTYLGSTAASLKAECVAVDIIGNIYVGGRANFQSQLPIPATMELSGFYYQPDMNTGDPDAVGPVDGFLLSWTPSHWLAAATYFGGEDWGAPVLGGFNFTEGITTLLPTPHYLYAAGYTSKVLVPDTSYFPLYDPGGDAWFQQNFNNQVPSGADGFVTGFCNDSFTSIDHSTTAPDRTQLSLAQWAIDDWGVLGLNTGLFDLWIHDALGRFVGRSTLRSIEGRSASFRTDGLAPGNYVLQVANRSGQRIGSGVKLSITR